MRLIDADKLIDYFYYGEDDKPIIDGIADRKIIKIINAQPTAYNVDKVVEELEDYMEQCNDAIDYGEGMKDATEYAIVIVRKGGVENG